MEETVCEVCPVFEPQTWRKSLCKNCFHTNAEHSGEVSHPTVTSQKEKSEVSTVKPAKGLGPPAKVPSTPAKVSITPAKVPSTPAKAPSSPAISPNKVGTGYKQLTQIQVTSKSSVSDVKSKETNRSDTTKSTEKYTQPSVKDTDIKSKETDRTDTTKSTGKYTPPSLKDRREAVKRVPVVVSKQITDVKVIGKSNIKEIKPNGLDLQSRAKSAKDSTAKTAGQKSEGTKSEDGKAHSGESAQVSKTASTGNRQNGGGVAASKVKHILRSFGTDELSDAHNTYSQSDKQAKRSEHDVTSKCQVGEDSHVTSKTLVIGREKDVVPTSAVRTVPILTGGSRSSKVTTSRPEDGGSGSKSPSSPSITISLRGGVTDIKVGKAETRDKTTGDTKQRDVDKAKDLEIRELKAKEKELIELKAKEKQLLAKEKEYNELKSREKELKDLKAKERSLKAKEKEYEKLLAKEKELEQLKRKEKEIQDKENEIKELKLKEKELRNLKAKEVDIKAKESEIRKQEDDLRKLKTKLADMEKKCKQLQDENTTLKRTSLHSTQEDAEQILGELRNQLSSMENRCEKLETDNSSLMSELKEKEDVVKRNSYGAPEEMLVLGQKFRDSGNDVSQVIDENSKLKGEIRDLREEMDEMYDTFRENEVDEFRDLQKELEITAKNCRIMQFKLRKAERRNEQVEADKMTYEERLRILQNQFESEDTRAHIRKVEEELSMAREVSVRLHDEIDLLDDKRSKAEEDSRHLTELLEQADKKQFRMEMEIDKLRDQIMDLKQELKYSGKQDSSDRKSSRL